MTITYSRQIIYEYFLIIFDINGQLAPNKSKNITK